MPDAPRRYWNFSAGIAGSILFLVNTFSGLAFVLGKISFEQYLAATGSINGLALGWVSKTLPQGNVT